MSRAVAPGLLLVIAMAVALGLRCPQLGVRPMHNDEAVNAIKFRTLWERDFYKYDPNEHHGPTLFYLTLAWAKLTGAPDFARFDEARFRMVTVLFGVGLILLLPLVADGLGRNSTLCAAALTAISPAMVFYSRYYIHEMPLVFFTLLALAAGWRYTRSRNIGWALLIGAAVGLMQGTKETFVLTLAAIAAALIFNEIWTRRMAAIVTQKSNEKKIERTKLGAPHPGPLPTPSSCGEGEESKCVGHFTSLNLNKDNAAPFRLNFKHLFAALAVWAAVAFVLFSSFFTNASGPLDSLRTYLPWSNRAAGASPHIHPWNFYLERLAFFHSERGPAWSEGLILVLTLAGMIAAFRRNGLPDSNKAFIRFLVIYTLALTVIYSAIAYKTPWCLLSFWLGMILLAGAGMVTVLHWLPRRWMKVAGGMLLLAGAGQLAIQAWQASVTYSADRRNPYVYAQTSPDLLNLVQKVEALAKASPQASQMSVKVMAPGSDYWPLPWYLRQFGQVGWWAELPPGPFAPVMIVSAEFHANLDEKKTHVMAGLFELRPGIFLELYVRLDLWRAYLETKPKQAEP